MTAEKHTACGLFKAALRRLRFQPTLNISERCNRKAVTVLPMRRIHYVKGTFTHLNRKLVLILYNFLECFLFKRACLFHWCDSLLHVQIHHYHQG